MESQLPAEAEPDPLFRTRSYPHTRHYLDDIASDDGRSSLEHLPDFGHILKAKAEVRGSEECAALGSDDDDDNEDEADERLNYTGGFQAPDTSEVIGVALSFGAVVVLAVAAGLTTIFDWVL